jgi:hypothetical protein
MEWVRFNRCFFGPSLTPGGIFVAQVGKEAPGHTGNFGIKVETKEQDEMLGLLLGGAYPCLASNAEIVFDGTDASISLVGGWLANANPVSVSMWVKNNTVSGDSTGIIVYAIDNSDGNDSIAGVADTLLGSNIGTWTKITLPFTYKPGFNTTLIKVLISSSGNYYRDSITTGFVNVHNGTWLAVDDIEISMPTGTTETIFSSARALVYPTVTDKTFHVQFLQADHFTEHECVLSDLSGKLVRQFTLNGDKDELDISDLPSSTYVYSILRNKQVIQTGRIIRR